MDTHVRDLFSPIPIDDLRAHIAQQSELVPSSYETGWDVEFNFLEKTTKDNPLKYDKEASISNLEANRPKNRYLNVLAADETIVKLQPFPANCGETHTGYINANWIKGAEGNPRTYIACQGPLVDTILDFWWMVWVENVSTIVMLTREEEKETTKCDRYWPNEGDILKSSLFTISCEDTQDDKYHVIKKRTLLVKNQITKEKRFVNHFQYIEWPDYGVPGSPFAFMQLISDVDAIMAEKPNCPLCVHCSAGIGRTGTFFSVHILMNQLRGCLEAKKPAQINVIDTVLKLREQRAGMVQTKGQFIFIYNAILFGYEQLKKEQNSGTKISVSDMEQDNQTQLRAARRGRGIRQSQEPTAETN